jgi:hypothetical protein
MLPGAHRRKPELAGDVYSNRPAVTFEAGAFPAGRNIRINYRPILFYKKHLSPLRAKIITVVRGCGKFFKIYEFFR